MRLTSVRSRRAVLASLGGGAAGAIIACSLNEGPMIPFTGPRFIQTMRSVGYKLDRPT